MDGDDVGPGGTDPPSRRIRRRPPCTCSGVRFWLQAITFMPNALATPAARAPSLPRPTMPSVRPSMSAPMRDLPGLARLHAGILEADPARQFEDQAEGDAGGRIAVAAGAADDDAALGRRLDVDRVVRGAGGDEELEVGQRLDHVAAEAACARAWRRRCESPAGRGGPRRRALERLVEHLDLDVASSPSTSRPA